MTDREKTLKGLECHTNATCEDDDGNVCPYWQDAHCSKTLAADAIALLKEQEPAKVEKRKEEAEWNVCSNCGGHLIHKWSYCPSCGREVSWDA